MRAGRWSWALHLTTSSRVPPSPPRVSSLAQTHVPEERGLWRQRGGTYVQLGFMAPLSQLWKVSTEALLSSGHQREGAGVNRGEAQEEAVPVAHGLPWRTENTHGERNECTETRGVCDYSISQAFIVTKTPAHRVLHALCNPRLVCTGNPQTRRGRDVTQKQVTRAPVYARACVPVHPCTRVPVHLCTVPLYACTRAAPVYPCSRREYRCYDGRRPPAR